MRSSTNRRRQMTAQDLAGALLSMSCLPKRTTINAEIEFAAYEVALDGVEVIDLAAAVRSVLQGALDHTFFPAPPELRKQCDVHRERRAIETAEQLRLRRPADQTRTVPEPTPEAKARAAELMKKFRDGVRIMPGGE